MDRWEMSTHILSGLLASGAGGIGREQSTARRAVQYADALIDALGEDNHGMPAPSFKVEEGSDGKKESSTRPQAD